MCRCDNLESLDRMDSRITSPLASRVVKAGNSNTAGETLGMTGAGFVQAAVSSILTRSIMLN